MHLQTFLPGKDAPLEETIKIATELLDRVGFSTEPTGWINPAPGCWSVHIRSKECRHFYTNGKGTSQQAALASGLGEFIERLSTNFFFSDFFLEDHNTAKNHFLFYPDEKWFSSEKGDHIPRHSQDGAELLNSHLLNFYDPEKELQFNNLCDHNSDDKERGICSLPFTHINSQKTVYFPVNILDNLYVSNGMAAGNSKDECHSQALSEIVERYVKNQVISKGISLPGVPNSVLKKYPRIWAILTEFKKHDIAIQVKDCSLGGKFPVICVLLAHRPTGGSFAAFGANFRFETAIERTLTELLQGRQIKQLSSFHPPVHETAFAADSLNLESHFINSDGLLSWDMFKTVPDYLFTPWNFSGTSQRECHLLRELINNCGYQIYTADYNHCGMPACRIIVPGMSEIYPVDDLIWNNKNSGSSIRSQLLRLPQMNRVELEYFLDILEELNRGEQHLISDLTGVLFDTDSAWHTLSVGELKALILLALGHGDDALVWCSWCHDHGNLPQHRRKLFRLLVTLLNFNKPGINFSDYREGLGLYYGEEDISEAQAVISGNIKFPGLMFADSWLEISREHDNLVKLYRELDEVKRKTTT